jgi:L-amino acid N-acyltransferase YncA
MYDFIITYPGSGDFTLFQAAEKHIHPGKTMANDPAETFLHSCYVITRHGAIVGRFVLYDNHSMHLHDKRVFTIGNYESVDTPEAAEYILNTACQAAKRCGAGFLIGPMNGSTWENYRFADYVSENDFFLEPENQAWYGQQFRDNGFDKIASYLSAYDMEMRCDFPDISKRKTELLAAGYTIRPIKLDNYEEELEKVYELSLDAYKNNFLYTPISRESFIAKYRPLKALIKPDFVLLAEDSEGKLAGYVFCVDDIKRKDKKRLILKSIARRPGRQDRGLGDVLGCEIAKLAKDSDYDGIIYALMHQQGSSVNLSKNRNAEVIKTYSLYAKEL